MPSTLTYPGVYIEEIPSGVRTVTGVATSITALIGRTRRGPTDKAVTINSFADFERIFGGLWEESSLSYAVRDFFLNGGSQAVIVRLFRPLFASEAEWDKAYRAAESAAGTTADSIVTLAGVCQQQGGLAEDAVQAISGYDASAREATKVARIAMMKAAELAKRIGATAADLYDAAKQGLDSAKTVHAKANTAAKAAGATADTVTTAADTAVATAQGTYGEGLAGAICEALQVALDLVKAGSAKPALADAVTIALHASEAAGGVAQAVEEAKNRLASADETLAAAKSAATEAQAVTAAARYGSDLAAKVQNATDAAADKGPAAQAVLAAATAAQSWPAVEADLLQIVDKVAAAAAAAAKVAEEAKATGATAKDIFLAVQAARDAAVRAGAWQEAPVAKAVLSVGPGALILEAASEGAWGNDLRARIDRDVDPKLPDAFNLAVLDGKTHQVEVFRNLSVDPADPHWVGAVLEQESQLVRLGSPPPDAVPGESESVQPPDDPFSAQHSSGVRDEASDGSALVENDYTGSGKQAAKQGLYALEQADLFNLLCIPPYKGEDVDIGLISKAAAYCEQRRAMLLVDPPSEWKSKQSAHNGFTDPQDKVGTRSPNAAMFFPRLKQPDPERRNQVRTFVPCGTVAGVFARTDARVGVWRAPAGLDATLVGVPELSVQLTDAENGELNQHGLNCLRAMPAAGRVVWGARTLEGDDRLGSEWKYIPVRRLALYIEESLYRGTQWVVFQPNDEPLWGHIRLNIGAFMHGLFRQGAFKGKTPQEAYFVKCDRETTIESDIARGIVNIVVGFAPLKPAEFVVIKIQQMAGQTQA